LSKSTQFVIPHYSMSLNSNRISSIQEWDKKETTERWSYISKFS